MPNTKGTKGRKVTRIYATRSRTGTSASQGPSSLNTPISTSAAPIAPPVLTSNSGARIDSQISGNTDHCLARSALNHQSIPISRPENITGHTAAMELDSDDIPMIPVPAGYLPGHRDWIKVYGKIQKCDYCNGRSKEGVIYMCNHCKIYICKPCAVAERHNRDPHDPHVLDANAVSWDGWERGANRPAPPRRPRGRPPKVVDKGREDAAEAATASVAATIPQAPQAEAANAASDAIVASSHPEIYTTAPASESSHKRTASALGPTQLPPSKQVKTGQPEQALPNRLPSINTLLQSLPEEFRTCPQNPGDYFSSKEHLATKKYFSAYHLPLHKSLAGFATSNQGHNHGRLPKKNASPRLPSIPPLKEISASSSSPQKSLHYNNNHTSTGPSTSRQDLDQFRDSRTYSSSASQALDQDRTALSSSSHHVSVLGGQTGSFPSRPDQDHQSRIGFSASHHRDLVNNNDHAYPLGSRDPDQYQSHHRGLPSTQPTQEPRSPQHSGNTFVAPSSSRQSSDVRQHSRATSLDFHQTNPSNRGSRQEHNSSDRHHPDRYSTSVQKRDFSLPYPRASDQGFDRRQGGSHLENSSTTSQHQTRASDQRQDSIASNHRRNSFGDQRYTPIHRPSYHGYQSPGQAGFSAPLHHRPDHSHRESFRQVGTATSTFSSQRSPGLDNRQSHSSRPDYPSRPGQDYFDYPRSPGNYHSEYREDHHHDRSPRRQD